MLAYSYQLISIYITSEMWRYHRVNFGLNVIYFLSETEHDKCMTVARIFVNFSVVIFSFISLPLLTYWCPRLQQPKHLQVFCCWQLLLHSVLCASIIGVVLLGHTGTTLWDIFSPSEETEYLQFAKSDWYSYILFWALQHPIITKKYVIQGIKTNTMVKSFWHLGGLTDPRQLMHWVTWRKTLHIKISASRQTMAISLWPLLW